MYQTPGISRAFVISGMEAILKGGFAIGSDVLMKVLFRNFRKSTEEVFSFVYLYIP